MKILNVSPLKAFSYDIQKNLELPLNGIALHLHLVGETPVNIQTAVDSGDTPAGERQKKIEKTSPYFGHDTRVTLSALNRRQRRAMLASVTTIIVNEIHALLGDK